MFYGQGAGGAPTASAVTGDLVMAARNRVLGSRGPKESKYAQLPVAPMGFISTRYYVSMNVADKPGVLSSVAAEFAKREVSIAEVRQEGVVGEGGQRVGARIVVVTHIATDAALSETVDALADLDVGAECRERAATGRNQRMSSARGQDRHPPALAGCDRGVPRPAAGRRRLDSGHPARGRHPADRRRPGSPRRPAARSISRSRASTPPAPSKTGA